MSGMAGGPLGDPSRPTLLGGPPLGMSGAFGLHRRRRVQRPEAAVLLLHGGREASQELTSSRQLAFLRMVDLYVGLRMRSTGTAVFLLRNRLRGWNATDGSDPDPVRDARWALDEIERRAGAVSVVVLGHSMGGRTGFRIAADTRVTGVVALAPWLPDGEPLVPARANQSFVIAHGTADTVTSASASLAYASRLRGAGGRVAWFGLAGGRHALMDRPLLWHRFAVTTSLGLAGDGRLPPAVDAALASRAADVTRVPMTSVMVTSSRRQRPAARALWRASCRTLTRDR